MIKNYTSVFLFLFFFNSLYAQVTVFASGIASNSIYLEDDDLYYAEVSGNFYKFNISDIDFPTSMFVYDVEDDAEIGVISFTKNGDDIYYSTIGGAGFPEWGSLYKLDTSTSTVTQLADGPPHITGANLEYRSGYLYYGSWTHTTAQNLRRINLGSMPPITPTTYVSILTESLIIDGFTMYFGTGDGEIYRKNMLIDTPAVLIYDGGVNRILDLELFESWLYFIDDEGIKRINPLEIVPISQLIVDDSDYGIFISLAAKSYDDGDRFLFAMEIVNDRILKIDLNDPTLSVGEAIVNKSVVFPNPTLNKVTIKSHSNIEKLSVYDMLGKHVLEISPTNQVNIFSLDIKDLSSGNYVLKICTALGVETRKLIKY